MKRCNPVRELDISPTEMKRIREAVNRELGGRGAMLRKAGDLYTRFTGHKDLDITRATVPKMPHVLVEVGQVDGILYTTVRDGVKESYIHKFKAKSRPLFAVSPDGKQLFMLGGAFTFGARGIVDHD
jgi:hypothetical protein